MSDIYNVHQGQGVQLIINGDEHSNTNGTTQHCASVVGELAITLNGAPITIANKGLNYVEAGTDVVVKSTTFNMKVLEFVAFPSTRDFVLTFSTNNAILDAMTTGLLGKNFHLGGDVQIKSLNTKHIIDHSQNTAVAFVEVKKTIEAYLSTEGMQHFMDQLNEHNKGYLTTTQNDGLNMCPRITIHGQLTAGEFTCFQGKSTNKTAFACTSPTAA